MWLTALLLSGALLTPTVAQASGESFYWKGSYGRGVGVIEQQYCSNSSQHLEAGLCYDNPRPGYNCNGTATCVADCPPGYSESGMLLCHYKGTALYTPPLHWDGCKYRTPRSCTSWGMLGTSCVGGDCIGGFDQDGCRDGYQKIALTCNKTLPPGFQGSPADPMRPTYNRAAGVVPVLRCNQTHPEQDASLCYVPCRTGYHGIGPVCWANTPSNYVDCGFGYAKNAEVCALVVAGQTMAAGSMLLDGGATLLTVVPGGQGALAAANDLKVAALAKARGLKIKNPAAFLAMAAKTIPFIGKEMASVSRTLTSGLKDMVSGTGGIKTGELLAFASGPQWKTMLGMKDLLLGSMGIADASKPSSLDQTEVILGEIRGIADIANLAIIVTGLLNPATVNPASAAFADTFNVVSSFAYPVYGQ